jgi:hypothetical protein
MKKLYLIWKSFTDEIFVLGILIKNENVYRFIPNYNEINKANNNGCYISSKLLQENNNFIYNFISARIFKEDRVDLKELKEKLGIKTNDLFEILKVTEASSINDNFSFVIPSKLNELVSRKHLR